MTIFLETQRLVIKAPQLSDLENWCALHAEADGMPYSRNVVKQWLDYHIQEFQQDGFSMGSVFLKDSNEFVGRAGLFKCQDIADHETAIEVGYVIYKKHWNKGYATELAVALIDWGWKNLNVGRFIAMTRLDNKKSQRVLEKARMQYVKTVESEGEDFFLYEIKN